MAINKLLQGMPRRISDYPDAFAGWNLISSFGSIISVVATLLFLHILYVQLVEGNATSRYPWLTPQFYSDSLQTILNRSYNSLEWCLTSPPKPHAFVSLPLQSSFIPTWFSKHFTPKKILILIGAFTLSLAVRLIFKQLDMIIFIESDVIYSICSFITIFTSSLLRAYLEMQITDITWYSVYNFIISPFSVKCKIISSFWYIISSGKGGQTMYTEVKSPIPNGSPRPDNVLLCKNAHEEGGSAATGVAPNYTQLDDYVKDILNYADANNIRGRYTECLWKLCVKVYDENTPLSSMAAETESLIEQDAQYKRASKKWQSDFKALPRIIRDTYPLTEAEIYKVPQSGLPATRLIKSLLQTEKDLDKMNKYVEREYGITDRKQLLQIIKDRELELPTKDRTLLDRWDSIRNKGTKLQKGFDKVNAERENGLYDAVASDKFTEAFKNR